MDHYFSPNRPGYPYPSNQVNFDQGRPPYPIGFDGMPSYNQPTSLYPPIGQPSFYPPQEPASISSGFPVAPSNNQSSYPPSFPTQQPVNYPPQYQQYPQQPNYQQSPNYPPSVPYQQNYSQSNIPSAPVYESAPIYTNQNLPSGPNYQRPDLNFKMIPSILPAHPFNPTADAERLYKAMKGFGTDETALIDVLCSRPSSQRLEIAQVFKSCYGKDLIKNIESETSGDFRTVLLTLLQKPLVIEATHLREAIQGLGTNESSLIDVICTKSNTEMIELKNVYLNTYRRNLEEDVKDDVSGYFKRFLVSLMSAHRSEMPPDHQKAVQQAKELYSAGEGRVGTNEVVFNKIISHESYAHLRLVFEEYQKLTGHPIELAISREMSTSIQRAFLTVIQIIKNPSAYFAQRLYESMIGLGTKDKLLIRMIVLRSDIDMENIKTEFQRKYNKTLASFIKSDCSGDYKRALLRLIADPSWK